MSPLTRILRPVSRYNRPLFTLGLIALFAAVFLAMDGLGFERRGDEGHFWRTSEKFSHQVVPTIGQLRDYEELSTPLPFVTFGVLDHLFGGEQAPGRYLNFALAFGIVLLIGFPIKEGQWRQILAACGLLACPYFLAVATHMYTDILACTFVLAGVWAHRGQKNLAGAICFALAIACRQYMLAFPAAIAAHEFLKLFWRQTPLWRTAWIAPTLAAATIFGWVAFFGGPGPQSEMADQQLDAGGAFTLSPEHSLYFLACLGAYFVIPAAILFRRIGIRKSLVIRGTVRGLAAAAVVGILFVLFPPLRNEPPYAIETMGYLDKALLKLVGLGLPACTRLIVFYLLAVVACIRLVRLDLAGWLVLANTLLMMLAHIAWDKYALPLLVVLWYLAGRNEQARPAD